MSYRNVLGRGFALVRDKAGAPLHNAAAIGADQPIRIEFSDGEVAALARPAGGETPASRSLKPGKRGGADDQGRLF